MRAELKAIISSDFDERSYRETSLSFSFWTQVFAGPDGEQGREQFQVEVCSPQWLLEHHNEEDVIFGTGRIIAFEYDWPRIERAVRRWVGGWSADTWHELALKLARLGAWEFDNYKPCIPALSKEANRDQVTLPASIRAEVKSITRSDFDERSDWEEGDNNFSFSLRVVVGPEGTAEGEPFQIQVCTPKWLLANHECDDVILGTGRIIVFEYHWPRIERSIRGWVSRRSAPNWPELALGVARLGPRERELSAVPPAP